VITVVGLLVALTLSGAVLTEKTFNWPGLGTALVEYVIRRRNQLRHTRAASSYPAAPAKASRRDDLTYDRDDGRRLDNGYPRYCRES